jgi:hypothetical protein
MTASNVCSVRITKKNPLPPMVKKSDTDRNQSEKNVRHIKFLQSRVVDVND